ncbi:hypothetical protein ACIBP6_04780 [Nonomuraea terrae]|uniref:hypothetical protein n=1 Tax=Nonomuraea terrae TaxID=2530383 RepID=UPI0037ABC43B
MIARECPVLRSDVSVLDVLAVMVRGRRPGVVIVGFDGRPVTALSLQEVLDLLLPWPFRESPNLAGAVPEEIGDRILAEAARRPIGDLPGLPAWERCRVPGGATTLQVLTQMSRRRSALAAVHDDAGSPVISADHLLERLLRVCESEAREPKAG